MLRPRGAVLALSLALALAALLPGAARATDLLPAPPRSSAPT